MTIRPFSDLNALATQLRKDFAAAKAKKFILLYAYNGTGKTRLSGAFRDLGKQVNKDGEVTSRDTLYFNAFTEDLFSWHNDLDNDSERYLTLHPTSKFFAGLEDLEMDNRIRPILRRYADFDFKLDTVPLTNASGEIIGDQNIVRFFRTINTAAGRVDVDNIKVSRSEENIFRWCFFLAILQLVLDGDDAYNWVKFVYIDDPISSLDESNAIAVANHLAQMLLTSDSAPKTVISSHHVLFFNVLCNEFRRKAQPYQLKKDIASVGYLLSETDSKPFLHHLANLVELNEIQITGDIKRHHFNMMRCIMEQTAVFCGLDGWIECIKVPEDDPERALHERMINVMSHADYLISEPDDLAEEQKDEFRRIFQKFISRHSFNKAWLPSAPTPGMPPAPDAAPAAIA